jgi:hypothetical protein
VIDQINTALKGKEVTEKVKKKLKHAAKNWPAKLKEYQEKEEILQDRNSYSKTDPDATFLRMKDDQKGKGQPKPGYNYLISTNNQFITCYTIEQDAADTTCLVPHLEEFHQMHNCYPKELTADAGFGSEENYEFMEGKVEEAYVKYNKFHKEQTQKAEEDPFNQDKLYYNEELDCFFCPMGQAMKKVGEQERQTRTGYLQKTTQYQAVNCEGCPLRSMCHTSENERIVTRNHNLERHKRRALKLLISEKGIKHRCQRSWDVEGAFGIIKQNKGFRRFLLRGKKNVEIEAGIIAIAHNISKLTALKPNFKKIAC